MAPFPEEANRAMVGRITELHFAPTAAAQENLIAERVNQDHILVTGNTVIDALTIVKEKVLSYESSFWMNLFGTDLYQCICDRNRRLVLVTGHRRENFGDGMLNICEALKLVAQNNPEVDVVYPVHLNPNVKGPVYELLSELDNIFLIDPLEYDVFVWLMNTCDIVLTDSGGIQEEAPHLGKPVLVMRETTERPEAVAAGTVKLVGTDAPTIVDNIQALLDDEVLYKSMATAKNPFGDGQATGRILDRISQHFIAAAE